MKNHKMLDPRGFKSLYDSIHQKNKKFYMIVIVNHIYIYINLFTKAKPFDKQPSNAHGNLEEHSARSLCSIP